MKKIIAIFLATIFLFSTPIYGSIYAEDIVMEDSTTTTDEETTLEDTTIQEDTTLAETLEEDTGSGITVWTVLFAILGASLFVLVAYYILKNFNIGSGK